MVFASAAMILEGEAPGEEIHPGLKRRCPSLVLVQMRQRLTQAKSGSENFIANVREDLIMAAHSSLVTGLLKR